MPFVRSAPRALFLNMQNRRSMRASKRPHELLMQHAQPVKNDLTSCKLFQKLNWESRTEKHTRFSTGQNTCHLIFIHFFLGESMPCLNQRCRVITRLFLTPLTKMGSLQICRALRPNIAPLESSQKGLRCAVPSCH